jgi:3-hydroxy-9,10-secoandrosta-1,3,5(10)-triene-9,17-dione monooxygenase
MAKDELLATRQEGTEVSSADVLARVRELVGDFRAAAEAGERARAIPRESVDKMLDAGLARALVPRRFGGYEGDLKTWFEITREISKADASHGWCASLLIHMPHYTTYFPLAGQEQVWANGPDVAIAGSLPPVCQAEPADGGYLITGLSPFASGVLHAAWGFVGGFLQDESGNPEWCWFLIPEEGYEVVDTWFTIGMRGTGSNTIATSGVFVPHERILKARHVIEGDVPGPRPSDNPLYGLPIAAYGPLGFSTAILGAAQGAYEEFRDWMETRLAPNGSRVAERPRIHFNLAKLAADIDAAELLLRRILEVAEAPTKPDSSRRARSLRDMAHAGQLCIGAIDGLMAMSGTAAFAETSVIGRAWRDIHFMAANLGISADNNYSHWGRLELGLERDPGMVIY